MAEFVVYRLEAEKLVLGERIKMGTYRPCITTLPSTQIEGALRSLGLDVPAVGYLTPPINKRQLTFAPMDHALVLAKLPITVEYLESVTGKVFISRDDRLPDSFFLRMGGLKSRGFGLCHLSKETVIKEPRIREGILRTRIREDQLENFGIRKLDPVVYGYLFKPTSEVSGVYCRSLFEGSRVEGYSFLLEG